MIHFERFSLSNKLTVLVNEDKTTPMVAMNILYKVGSRDEEENKTGFAHLFEHLMFGGSVNIPQYDVPLERAGGENNAFTNNDFTNYYLTIPARNVETAFWLESDRMLSLAFSEESLEVQRRVVIEEFKQSYLNKPYGDAWLALRPLAYRIHPYKWNTIGKDISHIENATLEDVRSFFYKYYFPGNAILSLSGNISVKKAQTLSEKWFGEIPNHPPTVNKYPSEPPQSGKRTAEIRKQVPADRIFKAYHCCARTDREYYATDLISDVLSKGNSSRLYIALVKERKMFTSIQAYLTGNLDKSLLVIDGFLSDGIDMEDAENAIDAEMQKIIGTPVGKRELQKVKQMMESAMVFSEIPITQRALNLAFFEMLGDASMVNRYNEFYNEVSAGEIQQTASDIINDRSSSVLYYLKNGKDSG